MLTDRPNLSMFLHHHHLVIQGLWYPSVLTAIPILKVLLLLIHMTIAATCYYCSWQLSAAGHGGSPGGSTSATCQKKTLFGSCSNLGKVAPQYERKLGI